MTWIVIVYMTFIHFAVTSVAVEQSLWPLTILVSVSILLAFLLYFIILVPRHLFQFIVVFFKNEVYVSSLGQSNYAIVLIKSYF